MRKSRKFIGKLKVGERVTGNARNIKKEVIKFFKKLYTYDNSICLKYTGTRFSKLTRK